MKMIASAENSSSVDAAETISSASEAAESSSSSDSSKSSEGSPSQGESKAEGAQAASEAGAGPTETEAAVEAAAAEAIESVKTVETTEAEKLLREKMAIWYSVYAYRRGRGRQNHAGEHQRQQEPEVHLACDCSGLGELLNARLAFITARVVCVVVHSFLLEGIFSSGFFPRTTV